MATGIDEWGEPDEGAYLRPDEEERPGWAPGIDPKYGEWMASSD